MIILHARRGDSAMLRHYLYAFSDEYGDRHDHVVKSLDLGFEDALSWEIPTVSGALFVEFLEVKPPRFPLYCFAHHGLEGYNTDGICAQYSMTLCDGEGTTATVPSSYDRNPIGRILRPLDGEMLAAYTFMVLANKTGLA